MKGQKNLRSNLNLSIIARNRTITKQRTLKHLNKQNGSKSTNHVQLYDLVAWVLFGPTTVVGNSLSSQSRSSGDCPTMNSSFRPLTASSYCGLQIAHPRTSCTRKCVLRKQEHPRILDRFLTRTTLWAPPTSTNRVSKLEVRISKNRTFSATLCLSVHVLSLRRISRQNVSKAFWHVTLPYILHMVLISSEVPVLYRSLGMVTAVLKVP